MSEVWLLLLYIHKLYLGDNVDAFSGEFLIFPTQRDKTLCFGWREATDGKQVLSLFHFEDGEGDDDCVYFKFHPKYSGRKSFQNHHFYQ